MKKPTVGQTLYSLNVGIGGKNNKQQLTPVRVTKVGRKYFTVQEGDKAYTGAQFHISTWSEKSSCFPKAQLYETQQEWEDEKEGWTISKMIYGSFEYGRNKAGLSLQKLREIARIIEQ